MPLSLREQILGATRRLTRAHVDSPRLSAELLLMKVTGLDRVALVTRSEKTLTDLQSASFKDLVSRREAGEPVAYLLGKREFFGRDMLVTPDTLIPRPETELLVEAALEDAELAQKRAVRFADLGTGSGCIAVTLAAERPKWRGVAVDISSGALQVAQKNAQKHKTLSRLCLIQGDFSFPILSPGRFDLIVSNPPYISESEYPDLSREVRDFEPASALVPLQPGADVLDGTKDEARVIRLAERALVRGGVLLIEHGWTQAASICLLLKSNTWKNVQCYNDLAGKNRFIRAVRC